MDDKTTQPDYRRFRRRFILEFHSYRGCPDAEERARRIVAFARSEGFWIAGGYELSPIDPDQKITA